MSLPDFITKVELIDCGDGSTSFHVYFADGTEWGVNEDIPHDAACVEITHEHGSRVMMHQKDANGWSDYDLPLIPDPDYN